MIVKPFSRTPKPSFCKKSYGASGFITNSKEVGSLSCGARGFTFTWNASTKPSPYDKFAYRPLFKVELEESKPLRTFVMVSADIPIAGAVLFSPTVDFLDESKGGADINKLETGYFEGKYYEWLGRDDVTAVTFGTKSYFVGYREDCSKDQSGNEQPCAMYKQSDAIAFHSASTTAVSAHFELEWKYATLVVFVIDGNFVDAFNEYANWLTLKVSYGLTGALGP